MAFRVTYATLSADNEEMLRWSRSVVTDDIESGSGFLISGSSNFSPLRAMINKASSNESAFLHAK